MREDRKAILLGFARSRIGGLSSVDFQKLVFLYTKEMERASPLYHFLPSKKGCYSYVLHHDLEQLCQENYLTRTPRSRNWYPTREGQLLARSNYDLSEVIGRFCSNQPQGDGLLRKVYRDYPEVAIKSEIVGALFPKADTVCAAIECHQPKLKDSVYLGSIGYEGKDVDQFFDILIRGNIQHLVDVRKNPLSHKWGFASGALRAICYEQSLTYHAMPELGIDSSLRQGLGTQESYDALFADYR